MANFPSMLAYDSQGNIARDAVGRIYALSDTAEARPLAVTDLNGVPFPDNVVPSSGVGVVAPFRVNGYTVVSWVSGPFRMDIPAVDIIPSDGAPGQVLSLGADGALVWIDPPVSTGGGGGGTSSGDYWNRTQTVPVIVISASAPWPTSAPEGALIVRVSGTVA